MDNNEAKKSELYTQRSMENLTSPDQLKDYLKVSGTPVWIVMIAVLILLVGIFVWSAFATFTSYTSAEGVVQNGVMTVTLHDAGRGKASSYKNGDEIICRIGEMVAVLSISGTDADGNHIAVGAAALPDGSYDVRLGYRRTKAIELLLN